MGEQHIKSYFEKAGFPLVGAVDYSSALPLYEKHAHRYQEWIRKGSHAEMQYLERGLERRLNPKLVFPEVESVVAVAYPYPAQPVGTGPVRYARYLNGKDYHQEIKEKLERAVSAMKVDFPNLKSKICVDTSAVLERSWASICGLGWIGKNTLLIHPQWGSYLFIGIVFLNQKLGMAPIEHPDYCGNCTRCMSACPTQAIPEPHYVESKDCISYLTLEKRGPWPVPPQNIDTRGYVAGCDLCQEVCPFNTKISKSSENNTSIERYLELNWDVLNAETEEEYQLRVKDTALTRVKFLDFKRNLAALKNC